jgi:cilia- and flagella-associated protein 65
VDKVEWRGWSPGGEYHRTLTVQNVTSKAIKFKYRLPESKYFSMRFPELIHLMPGMSLPIRVMFRPVKMEPYADVVQIHTAGAAFVVKIMALTPSVKVEIPSQLDFGFSPVNEVWIPHIVKVSDCPFHRQTPSCCDLQQLTLTQGKMHHKRQVW